jgi:hypothetical protein
LGLRDVVAVRTQAAVGTLAFAVISLASLDTLPVAVTRRLALVVETHAHVPGTLTGLGRTPRKEREEQRRRQDGKREKRF